MDDNNNLPNWEETLARLERAAETREKVVSITRGRKKKPTDQQKKELLKAFLQGLLGGVDKPEGQ